MMHIPVPSLDTIVFSDIQGNFPALKRLFQHPDFQRDDTRFVCLGDMVQSGTRYDDYLCVWLLQQRGMNIARGNHEDKILSQHTLHPAFFPEGANFLEDLPRVLSLGQGAYASHHGPDGKGYLRDVVAAQRTFELVPSDTFVYFFGHSHQQLIFDKLSSGAVLQRLDVMSPLQLRDGSSYLINPGAVGARGIPSTYLVYDSARQEISFKEITRTHLRCNR